jgi:hypothetical protein
MPPDASMLECLMMIMIGLLIIFTAPETIIEATSMYGKSTNRMPEYSVTRP